MRGVQNNRASQFSSTIFQKSLIVSDFVIVKTLSFIYPFRFERECVTTIPRYIYIKSYFQYNQYIKGIEEDYFL